MMIIANSTSLINVPLTVNASLHHIYTDTAYCGILVRC